MLHAVRRPHLDGLALVSLVALVGACGTRDGDSADSVPSFSGLAPGAPAAPATPPTPSTSTPPSNEPGPPDPARSSEAPGSVPLDMNASGAPPAQGSGQPTTPETPGTPEQPETPETETTPEPPNATPEPPEDSPPSTQPQTPVGARSPDRPTRGTANLFTELLGKAPGDVDAKVRTAVNRAFGIGTGESATPNANAGYRIYYELPQDTSQAFIWCADQNDVRSEGQSYGMMIAVQMNLQPQFDKLWKFAKENMQIRSNDAWNRYFRWQGQVSVNGNGIGVNFGSSGPAPDGDAYLTAALYLADRRWGSAGGVNYEQEADAIASAMLHNTAGGGQTPLFNPQNDMVVFYPSGGSATFSDPSYHLPAFYELFAEDGDPADSTRWRQIADVSRQFFVASANASTGLHPDYANFNGTPNAGSDGQPHDQFRFDAWRVPMNMAVDYVWTGADARLSTQVEKYHAFFAKNGRLGQNNVNVSLFTLDGLNAGDGGGSSTALTATLAAGSLISSADNRADFVQALWNVNQQSGFYRYYQESVYLLGLLATAGWYGYDWLEM